MKNISYISCPSCGFIMKPVWYLEKELDTHGIPTGRTHKACGGYNFKERKEFWDSFFDFKAPKLRLPVEITKPSGKDGIAQ